MQNRILGTQEIYRRLSLVKASYPLTKLLLTPDQPITATVDAPGALILEAEDSIVERAYKTFLGYPVKRQLEVVVELWDRTTGNIRTLYSACRQAILVQPNVQNGVLLQNVFVREEKTYGPFNLGNPGVLGFRVVFIMNYYDEGPI